MDAFWGEESRLSDLEALRCKGNWLASRRRYVAETWGDAMVARIAEALAPRERELFQRPPLTFTWHPFRSLCLIDEQISSLAMGGDRAAMRAFGAALTGYDLNVLYRAFFRIGTPEFLLSKSHLLWRQYASGGALRSKTTPGHAELVFSEIVIPVYLCRDGITGYLDAATVAAGAEQVQVRHSGCVHKGDPSCRYEIDWT